MNRSIVFLILTFFISSGFVSFSKNLKKETERQQKFLEFLSHFDKVSLPYKLELQTIESFQSLHNAKIKTNLISEGQNKFTKVAQEFLPSIRFGRFSRMGQPIIHPMARFFPDDKTVAVIYKTKMRYGSPVMNDYMLAYYDLKGNLLGTTKKKRSLLSDQRIGFTNFQHTQVFTIYPSGKIETVLYDNHWKEKIGSGAMEKNELLGFKKVKEVNYQLAGTQGIQEIAFSNARP